MKNFFTKNTIITITGILIVAAIFTVLYFMCYDVIGYKVAMSH